MNIKLVCVGKIKESFYREAIAEYAKRLSRFCKLEIIEVAEELSSGNSEKAIQAIVYAEGQRILAQLKGWVCVLDLKGKQLTSPEIAQQIQSVTINGESQLCYVIGGSHGLDKAVLARADSLLCFGKVTYPHQLMRVILTEQIYRAFMILENSPYHK